MDKFHVIVLKDDGTLAASIKDSETSAIKSAKAHVTLRKQKAAVVIQNGKVLFEIPEGTRSDDKFMTKARKKAHENTIPLAETPPAASTKTKAIFPGIAAEYDKAVKEEKIPPATSTKKPKPCNMMDILESACLALSLSRGIPVQEAQEICEQHKPEMEILATNLSSGAITRDTAVEQLVSVLTKKIRKIVPMNSIEGYGQPLEVSGPVKLVNMQKIMRGRKGLTFSPTRIRFDIAGDDDLTVASPTALPNGIMIYTTKDTDVRAHEIVARAHGYEPAQWINSHMPSTIAGFDYQKTLTLGRPSYRSPIWTASGGRIASPSALVQQIRNEFPDETKVLVVVAHGVDLV